MSPILRVSALVLLCSSLGGCFGPCVEDDPALYWLTQLRSPQASERIGAAANLGLRHREDPARIREIVSALQCALDDPAGAVVEAAVRSLGNFGPHAAPALESLLRISEAGGVLRDACWQTIPRLGEVALPLLRRAIADPDPRLRRSVVQGLSLWGTHNDGFPREVVSRPIILLLIAALRDDDDLFVRNQAAYGLAWCRPAGPTVLQALTRALRDQSRWVQLTAVNALQCLEPAATSAVPHLRAMLAPQRELQPWLQELHEEPPARLRIAVDQAIERLRE